MNVFIPTTKRNDASKGIHHPNVQAWGSIKAEELHKIGLTRESLETNGFGFVCDNGLRSECYCIYMESIDSEVHHYGGARLAYLNKYGVKSPNGYILPTDKASDWLGGNIPPIEKDDAPTVNISVCQPRVSKVGGTYVQKLAALNDPETGLMVIERGQLKHYKNIKHININVTRPQVMWGTEEEIMSDIKDIIWRHLRDNGIIDQLINKITNN